MTNKNENFHPINIVKHCLRCGSDIFVSKDHGHSFKCEACGFHYFVNNSAAVSGLIFNDKGQLLLGRRAIDPNKGMLDLPGGFVDPNESAEDALVREIFEELQVNVVEMEYLISFPNEYPFSGMTIFTLDMAFLCTVDNIDKIIPSDDIDDIGFYDLMRIDSSQYCSESMKEIIDYYILNNYK